MNKKAAPTRQELTDNAFTKAMGCMDVPELKKELERMIELCPENHSGIQIIEKELLHKGETDT